MSNNGAPPSYDVGTMSIRNGSSQSLLRSTFSLINYTYKKQGGAPKLHTQQNTPYCKQWSAAGHTAVRTQWVLFLKI